MDASLCELIDRKKVFLEFIIQSRTSDLIPRFLPNNRMIRIIISSRSAKYIRGFSSTSESL